jgi:hypothetical protein
MAQKILFTGLLSFRLTGFAWSIEFGGICLRKNYITMLDFYVRISAAFRRFHQILLEPVQVLSKVRLNINFPVCSKSIQNCAILI